MEQKPAEEFPSIAETMYKLNGTLMNQNKILEQIAKAQCKLANLPYIPPTTR